MTFAIVVQPQAEADLAAAFDWYQQRKPGLGFELLDEAETSISSLSEQPFRHQCRYRDARTARLRRFPYVVIYTVRESSVFVLGVVHERRHPRVFRQRAQQV